MRKPLSLGSTISVPKKMGAGTGTVQLFTSRFFRENFDKHGHP